MTTTTKIRGLSALAAYIDLRCQSAGQWRLATIVDKDGNMVYELGSKRQETGKGQRFMEWGFYGERDKLAKTHRELLEIWENMI